MSAIEVKIARNNTELTSIVRNHESDGLTAFVANLQQAKQDTNDYLTTLVEADKLAVEQQPKEAVKRKSEPIPGNIELNFVSNNMELIEFHAGDNGAKRSTGDGETQDAGASDSDSDACGSSDEDVNK